MDQLIDDLDEWEIEHEGDLSRPGNIMVVASLVTEASPAWQRVLDVLEHRTLRRRTADA